MVLTETWLHPDVSDSEIFPDFNNYNLYRQDRVGRRGGGVLIGIKKSLSSFSIPTNSSLEIAWAGCTTATKRILIGACYRPPAADPKFTDNLRQSLEMATHSFPSDCVYLLGDFNFPQIDWLTLSSLCHNSNNFLNFSLDFNLFQVVNEPTRESNTLDLILTTAPETVETISFLDGFSDHKLLQLSLRIPLAHAGTVTKKHSRLQQGQLR